MVDNMVDNMVRMTKNRANQANLAQRESMHVQSAEVVMAWLAGSPRYG